MVPMCEPHLELCRRYGYPARRVLDAGVVEWALLGAYAADVLRFSARPARSEASARG